jgi:uncharacterized protein
MSFEIKINDGIKTAMLGKNEVDLRTLRAIKASILLAKTSEGAASEISDEDGLKIIQKLLKSRKDSLEIYTTQNRPDLAIKEEEEIAVLERYMPEQLSEEALTQAVQKVILQVGAASAADMGKVMGAATKQLSGQADGKVISAMVKKLLG